MAGRGGVREGRQGEELDFRGEWGIVRIWVCGYHVWLGQGTCHRNRVCRTREWFPTDRIWRPTRGTEYAWPEHVGDSRPDKKCNRLADIRKLHKVSSRHCSWLRSRARLTWCHRVIITHGCACDWCHWVINTHTHAFLSLASPVVALVFPVQQTSKQSNTDEWHKQGQAKTNKQ